MGEGAQWEETGPSMNWHWPRHAGLPQSVFFFVFFNPTLSTVSYRDTLNSLGMENPFFETQEILRYLKYVSHIKTLLLFCYHAC